MTGADLGPAPPPPPWAAEVPAPEALAEPDELRDHEDLLFRLHRLLRPRTYVEVGVNRGHSLRWALPEARVAAVDPALDLGAAPPCPPATTLLPLPSDEAFGTGSVAAALGGPVDLAFVDGLHLVEQVLRDVANVERLAHAGTVLLLHDTLPPEPAAADRERRTLRWTGDVWKAVVVLRRARPDLAVATLAVPPSGVTVVTGLDPGSRVLDEGHEELVASVAGLDWVEDGRGHEDELLGRVPGRWSEVLARLPRP